MSQSFIPYGRQDITDSDIDAVVAVLKSDWLTQGPTIPRFETLLANKCGAKYAVAVSNATAALHVACLAMDLAPGDILWTSPNTFVASANCALYCGASVEFVDIDLNTGNMSVAALAEKLETADRAGTLPKIVVPVHYSGQSCDMEAIKALSQRYGFRIIEDAAHAVGGSYRNGPVGDCRYSDAAVFSFHPVKIITTGEGGAVTTNDPDLAARMARLRSHGSNRDPALMRNRSEGAWYYEVAELGWNYRMTDIQAAIGCSQIVRLDDYVARRTALADRYDRLLAGSGLALPHRDCERRSAWHLYSVGWNEAASGIARAEAFARMREAGIGVQVHYIPVHLHPYFSDLGFKKGEYPNAESHYSRSITIPLFAGMTEDQQDRVVGELWRMSGQAPLGGFDGRQAMAGPGHRPV